MYKQVRKSRDTSPLQKRRERPERGTWRAERPFGREHGRSRDRVASSFCNGLIGIAWSFQKPCKSLGEYAPRTIQRH